MCTCLRDVVVMHFVEFFHQSATAHIPAAPSQMTRAAIEQQAGVND